eukprot:357381-Chlamydomonas_euryale.AAC.1
MPWLPAAHCACMHFSRGSQGILQPRGSVRHISSRNRFWAPILGQEWVLGAAPGPGMGSGCHTWAKNGFWAPHLGQERILGATPGPGMGSGRHTWARKGKTKQGSAALLRHCYLDARPF